MLGTLETQMATSIFQVSILKILVELYLLSLVFGPKIVSAAGVHENASAPVVQINNENDPSGFGGSGGNEGVEMSALCSIDFQSFLPPPYGNVSGMICKPVWNTFLLRYLQNKDHVMTIILSAMYTTGWVGIGFSKDGMMAGSSAMVGWFNKKGHSRIKQFYLQGTHPSQVIADNGELPLVNVPPVITIHGAMIYLAFQLKFENYVDRQPIILAFGSRTPNHFRLTHHDDKRTIMFDFSGGPSSVLRLSSRQKRNHGALGIVGWGLILPVGAIVARYLRHKDPLWYYLHAVIQLVGFTIGLATALLGLQLYDQLNVKNANIDAHRGIGIFILVLSILQILAFFLRPNKDAKIRGYWNWYHNWFGRLALFFGAINIVLGIQIGYAGNDWKIGYGFLLGIILLSVIVLEALSWMKRSDEKTTSPTFQMNPMQ